MGNTFNTGRLINGLFVDASGNVGIGTTTPAEKLSVIGNIRIDNGAADGGQLVLASSGFSDWNLDSLSGRFRAYYGSTEYFTILANGNVGIGTTTPSGKLNIIGGELRWGFTSDLGVLSYSDNKPILASVGATDFLFYTNGLERLRIKSGGNVLIGTTSDDGNKLQVNGNISSSRIFTSYSGIKISGYGALSQTISGQMTILGHNIIADTSAGNTVTVMNSGWYSSMIKQYYNEGITFHTSTTVYNAGDVYPMTSTERMRITSGGSVLINRTATPPSVYKLIVNTGTDVNVGFAIQDGEASIEAFNDAVSVGKPLRIYGNPIRMYNTIFFMNYGNGSLSISGNQVVSSSDINLKIDDGKIDNALDKVLQLNPRYFYWKEDSGIDTKERQLGFYAQDVKEALGEEVANDNGNGKWGIYDRGIIAMLTKAIQELNDKVTALENK